MNYFSLEKTVNNAKTFTIPQWWEITFGVLLFLFGVSLFFLFSKTKKQVEFYKERQLEEYKKQNKKFKGSYEQARLVLPWLQRMKLVMWPVIGISCCLVGIFFATGFMFTFFTR